MLRAKSAVQEWSELCARLIVDETMYNCGTAAVHQVCNKSVRLPRQREAKREELGDVA